MFITVEAHMVVHGTWNYMVLIKFVAFSHMKQQNFTTYMTHSVEKLLYM